MEREYMHGHAKRVVQSGTLLAGLADRWVIQFLAFHSNSPMTKCIHELAVLRLRMLESAKMKLIAEGYCKI